MLVIFVYKMCIQKYDVNNTERSVTPTIYMKSTLSIMRTPKTHPHLRVYHIARIFQ